MKFLLVDFNNNKFDIGSKLYPVRYKKHVKVFTYNNTKKIQDSRAYKAIDSLQFNPGFCYTNADMLCKKLKENGVCNPEFYAGWYIVGDKSTHHAWVVIDGNLIDVNIRQSMYDILKTVDYKNPQWRQGAAMRIKAAEKRIKLSQDCICGKVFKGMCYAGTRDKPELAKTRFNILMKRFPKHPSYAHKGANPTGLSEFQKEWYKDGL